MDNSVQATRKKESTDGSDSALKKEIDTDTSSVKKSGATTLNTGDVNNNIEDEALSKVEEQISTEKSSHTSNDNAIDNSLESQTDTELKINGVSLQQNQKMNDNQKTNNEFANAVLSGVQVEQMEEKPKINVSRQEKDKKNNLDPQKQEADKGHYETKPKGFLFWGFILCCCILTAPLGGGFAFLLTPAQFASFGLVAFWKRGKMKVWKIDKKSMPEDSLITQQDFEKMITNAEKGSPDNILTPVPEDKTNALLNELIKDVPAEQKQKVAEDLNAFSTAIQALAISEGMPIKDAQEMTSFMTSLGEKSNTIQSISNSDIKKAMEDFIMATDDQSKSESAKRLVDNLQKITHEIAPATEEFPHKELLTQLMNEDPEMVKKMTETLAKRHDAVKNKINSLSGLETSNYKTPSHTSSLNNRNVNEKSIGR